MIRRRLIILVIALIGGGELFMGIFEILQKLGLEKKYIQIFKEVSEKNLGPGTKYECGHFGSHHEIQRDEICLEMFLVFRRSRNEIFNIRICIKKYLENTLFLAKVYFFIENMWKTNIVSSQLALCTLSGPLDHLCVCTPQWERESLHNWLDESFIQWIHSDPRNLFLFSSRSSCPVGYNGIRVRV